MVKLVGSYTGVVGLPLYWILEPARQDGAQAYAEYRAEHWGDEGLVAHRLRLRLEGKLVRDAREVGYRERDATDRLGGYGDCDELSVRH